MNKVISIGDTLCLLTVHNTIEEYVIEDICVYIAESGNYEIGFFSKNGKEQTPYWMFKELCRDGLMWKKGQEVVAEKIREIREKQNKANKGEW